MIEKSAYIERIIKISRPYLEETFPNKKRYNEFLQTVNVLKENKKVAKRGGNVAGVARKQTEKELGRTIISEDNFLPENKKLSTALEIN